MRRGRRARGAALAAALAVAIAPPAALGAQDSEPSAREGAAAGPARVVRTINREWTFSYFPAGQLDPAVAAPGYDDARWPAVALPHTWSTFETTRELHPFIRSAAERDDPYWWFGWGWYRKRFVAGRELAGRKVFAEFDGAQKHSRVYLNGRLAGEHRGGYNSFSVDLTPLLRVGGENVLAVAVSNRRDDRSRIPPMTAGNFDVYGGIYRDVRLVVTDPLHIPYQGSAAHEGGTFVTTPQVDSARGVVRVQTFVRNDHADARAVTVRTRVVDAAGREVARMEARRRVAAAQTLRFDQTSPAVERPRLWSPETPHVYRVHSEVWSGGRLRDRYESPLGFRWFRWDRATDNLYLNGRPVHVHGTNRHQEYPWLGDAMPKTMHGPELVQIRRDLGMNFLRAAHYPNDPVVYDHADSLGIITVEEVPNIKSIDFAPDVQEQNARAMVRRDRNHPSILFWSLGNETNRPAQGRWVRAEDSTRIIHLRHGPPGDSAVQTTHEDLELENQLRVAIRGWYDRDERDLRPENGQAAGTEEWQHARMRVHDGGRARIDEDMVHWLFADHGADREYTDAPLKHVNPKGWVDAYRVPKYAYWLWRANWSGRPTLFVHPHVWRERYVGQRRDVVVDANTDAVELKVNGRSLGRRVPDRANFFSVTFPGVLVERGTLTAEGRRGGVLVRDSVVMAGAPARLVLTADRAEVAADRAGIAVVSADVVDARGVHVYGANPPLAWAVAGPGRLVGPERYASDRDRHEAMEGTMYIDAPVKNVVRSTSTPGTIVVRVSAPGLAPAEVAVRSAPPPRDAGGPIVEPPLSDRGRRPVARDSTYRAEAALPQVAAAPPLRAPLRVVPGPPAATRAAVRAALRAHAPAADTTTPAYEALADELAAVAARGRGEVVEDDFNSLAGRYTQAARLHAFVDGVPLHPMYRAALQAAYADALVRRGAPLDLEDERRRLLPLLSGARVVLVVDGDVTRGVGTASGLREVRRDSAGGALAVEPRIAFYQANARTLGQLLTLFDPGFARLSSEQQARAYRYVDDVNPHVRCGTGAGPAGVCAVDRGRALVVPAPDVLARLP